MNYISATRMFNTGFLPPNSNAMRVQQGLLPQNFVNDCAYNYQGKSTGLAGKPVQMYPAGVTPLPTYGWQPTPTNCPGWGYPPCTQFVQPP
jgi:hypothetical protein